MQSLTMRVVPANSKLAKTADFRIEALSIGKLEN